MIEQEPETKDKAGNGSEAAVELEGELDFGGTGEGGASKTPKTLDGALAGHYGTN